MFVIPQLLAFAGAFLAAAILTDTDEDNAGGSVDLANEAGDGAGDVNRSRPQTHMVRREVVRIVERPSRKRKRKPAAEVAATPTSNSATGEIQTGVAADAAGKSETGEST